MFVVSYQPNFYIHAHSHGALYLIYTRFYRETFHSTRIILQLFTSMQSFFNQIPAHFLYFLFFFLLREKSERCFKYEEIWLDNENTKGECCVYVSLDALFFFSQQFFLFFLSICIGRKINFFFKWNWNRVKKK